MQNIRNNSFAETANRPIFVRANRAGGRVQRLPRLARPDRKKSATSLPPAQCFPRRRHKSRLFIGEKMGRSAAPTGLGGRLPFSTLGNHRSTRDGDGPVQDKGLAQGTLRLLRDSVPVNLGGRGSRTTRLDSLGKFRKNKSAQSWKENLQG